MHVLCVVALLAAQTTNAGLPADTNPVTTTAADTDVVTTEAAPPTAVTAPAAPAAAVVASAVIRDDGAYRQMHGVLAGFAGQARTARVTTAVGAGALSAAMIGMGITYVAVGKVDIQLSKIDSDDTVLAGTIVGVGAVLPAAMMVGAIVMGSEEERRFADFEIPAATEVERQARIDAARASLTASASKTSWLQVAGGGALITGGLVSAGVGGRFIQLPHLPNPRGIVTHSIGAELIGAGLISAIVGGTLIATSGSTAGAQLAILGE